MPAMRSCVMCSSLAGLPVRVLQQPAAQLLLQRVVAVAGRTLCHVREQGLRVAQQLLHHRLVHACQIGDLARPHAPGQARALHDGAAQRLAAAHEGAHADHAFAAHHGHLGAGAVQQGRHQRHDGRDREVHVAQHGARLVQHVAAGQRHAVQVRRHDIAELGRQRGQQAVAGVGGEGCAQGGASRG
jgi:hypothetical protein